MTDNERIRELITWLRERVDEDADAAYYERDAREATAKRLLLDYCEWANGPAEVHDRLEFVLKPLAHIYGDQLDLPEWARL